MHRARTLSDGQATEAEVQVLLGIGESLWPGGAWSVTRGPGGAGRSTQGPARRYRGRYTGYGGKWGAKVQGYARVMSG